MLRKCMLTIAAIWLAISVSAVNAAADVDDSVTVSQTSLIEFVESTDPSTINFVDYKPAYKSEFIFIGNSDEEPTTPDIDIKLLIDAVRVGYVSPKPKLVFRITEITSLPGGQTHEVGWPRISA